MFVTPQTKIEGIQDSPDRNKAHDEENKDPKDSFVKLKNEKSESEEQRLGIMFMLASTLVQSWNWLSIKIAYILNPEFDGLQILFMRTIFASLVLILIINKNIKFVMIDSFPTENMKWMVLRVLSGLFGISSMMVCVKWFSLTTISVVTGLNPVITMIFGVLLMKEAINSIDIVCIFLSFFAVILMTLGLAY